MTVAEVRKRIKEIKRLVAEHDDEVAHGKEDDLRDEVLRAIAYGGAANAGALVRAVLKTGEIKFARHCG